MEVYGGQRILAFELTTAITGAYNNRHGVLKVITNLKAKIAKSIDVLVKRGFRGTEKTML